jgi:hypothetical protein
VIQPPAIDFGRMQVGRWAQASLELENWSGVEVEVRSIAFSAGSQNPGDFSFVVAGDPVPVLLPIEAVPGEKGVTLQPSADFGDAPILKVEEDGDLVRFSVGDPVRGSGIEPLTLYGQPARLVGSLLLRDDPEAAISPSAMPYPRPFSMQAFAERRPPFVLGPEQSVQITVIAQPTVIGPRSARIRVEAAPIGAATSTQTLEGAVLVSSLSGPQLQVLPDQFIATWMYEDGTERWAMIANVGHFDLEVTRLAILGRDASRFALTTWDCGRAAQLGAPPFWLAPADCINLGILYTPECDGSYVHPFDHEALLRIESNAGNREVSVYGRSESFCP